MRVKNSHPVIRDDVDIYKAMVLKAFDQLSLPCKHDAALWLEGMAAARRSEEWNGEEGTDHEEMENQSGR